ncbi:hypothetical protein SNE40_016336 [Patella caerulea]
MLFLTVPATPYQFTCAKLKLFQSGYLTYATHLDTIATQGLQHCSRECLYHTNCDSVNFDTTSGQCELNRYKSSTSLSNIIPGSIYINKRNMNPAIAGPCSGVVCQENYKCVPLINGTKCALVDCGLLPNDKVKYNGTVIGSKATVYYLFGHNPKEFICKNNGTWVTLPSGWW